MFGEHEVVLPRPEAKRKKASPPTGSIQGWICRNGTISANDGALSVTPDPNAAKNAKPFLAKSGLSLKGPLTFLVKAEARDACFINISWRTKHDTDFIPANAVRLDFPAGTEERRVTIPTTDEVIHVRIHFGDQTPSVRLRSIAIAPASGAGDRTDFKGPNP